MTEIWKLIQENWVGTILGLIALVIAIYEMLKQRGPSLSYQFTGQRIVGRQIDPLPSQVTIVFEGQPVDHLSKTEIILWNAGPAALRRNDIPATVPLTVSFRKSRILMSEVTKVVRESSNIQIDISDNRDVASISFEYLDKGDGALLTFWHDSVDSTPLVDGVIIGQSSGIAAMGRFIPRLNANIPLSTPAGRVEKVLVHYGRYVRRVRLIKWLPVAIGVFLIVGSLFQNQFQKIVPFLYADHPNQRTMWLGTGLGMLYVIPWLLLLRLYARKFPKELIPPEFAPLQVGDDTIAVDA